MEKLYAVGVLVLMAGSGCAPRIAKPAEGLAGIERRAERPDLAVITRPTGGLVRLSLVLDAGARDADPPQVATLAARLAAARVAPAIQAEVFPDATEFALDCEHDALRGCLRKLAQILTVRDVDPEVLSEARMRLSAERRRALGRDPGRMADRLALEALLGDDAAGFFPFGRTEQDMRATEPALSAFYAAHYAGGRALLVGAGDLRLDELDEGAEEIFGRRAQAGASRAARPLKIAPGDRVGVEIDEVSRVTLAMSAANLERATALTRALRLAVESNGHGKLEHGHVFEVRGGTLALMRFVTSTPDALVTRVSFEYATMRSDPPRAEPARPRHDTLEQSARRLALQWSADAAVDGAPVGLGVGVIVKGGRGETPKLEDPDAAARTTWTERLHAAVREGRARADVSLTGTLDERRASARIDNGARIEARRVGTRRVAVDVRFDAGARHDPAQLHGRAALLAVAASQACVGLDRTVLIDRLRRMDAFMDVHVAADSWELSIDAPAPLWADAVDVVLRCALRPRLDEAGLDSARVALAARFEAGNGREFADAASLLSPGAPGAIAPWGAAHGYSSISADQVRQWATRTRIGALVSVALVGDVPIPQAAHRIARHLAWLPGGQPPVAPAIGRATQPERLTLKADQVALLGWRVEGASTDPAGARAFAVAMRATLTGHAGLEVTWHGGDAGPDGAWAALAARCTPAAVQELERILDDAASTVASALLEEAVSNEQDRTAQRERASAAQLAVRARRLIGADRIPTAGKDGGDCCPSGALEIATRLAEAEPAWRPAARPP